MANTTMRTQPIVRTDRPTAIYCDDNHTFYDFKLPYLRGKNDVDYVWLICALLVLVGNISVLVWRCTRRSDQRNSVSSILIINLATADLLLGIQWPCSALEHETVAAIFCNVSALLQVLSVSMSSLTTVTIAFYFLISLTCPRSPHTCILALLASEWMFSFCASGIVTATFDAPYNVDDKFDFSTCLPTAEAIQMFGIELASFLLIAVIVYIVLLIKIKQQGNHPGASTSVAQIQLIFIAFASFLCWGMSVAIYYLSPDGRGRYYDQYCIAGVAISNPLVFTLMSKPFIKSAKRVWQCFCYKCGRPTPIDQIHSSEEERDPLLTKVASQTNYSSSDGKIDV